MSIELKQSIKEEQSQERTESLLDIKMDDVLYLMEELMLERGVYHCQIHFSTSRATI
jgi:hypothetical protein